MPVASIWIIPLLESSALINACSNSCAMKPYSVRFFVSVFLTYETGLNVLIKSNPKPESLMLSFHLLSDGL